MFKLGEIQIPTDDDVQKMINVCKNNEGWSLDYNKKNIKVYLKKTDLTTFQMLKTEVEFDDVSASTLYDVLMDTEYRRVWDDFMIEGYDYCYVTPFSDVGYYAVKSPKPLKNRDFVMQRCWLDFGPGSDKIICSHSINHSKIPVIKNRVRGLTYMAVSYIKPTSPKSCSMIYVTQSDPGGSLPSWIVNTTSKVVAPKFIKKIYKASLKYDKWKLKHNSEYKPWSNPEVISIPKLDKRDIKSYDLNALRNIEDESHIGENEIDKNDLIDD